MFTWALLKSNLDKIVRFFYFFHLTVYSRLVSDLSYELNAVIWLDLDLKNHSNPAWFAKLNAANWCNKNTRSVRTTTLRKVSAKNPLNTQNIHRDLLWLVCEGLTLETEMDLHTFSPLQSYSYICLLVPLIIHNVKMTISAQPNWRISALLPKTHLDQLAYGHPTKIHAWVLVEGVLYNTVLANMFFKTILYYFGRLQPPPQMFPLLKPLWMVSCNPYSTRYHHSASPSV